MSMIKMYICVYESVRKKWNVFTYIKKACELVHQAEVRKTKTNYLKSIPQNSTKGRREAIQIRFPLTSTLKLQVCFLQYYKW